jgi:PAS domain S-box-containing protein
MVTNGVFEENVERKKEELKFGLLDFAPVGILTFSADWKIEFISQIMIRLGAFYNMDLNDLLGNNILKTVLIPGISLADDLTALREGLPFEKEIRNIKTSGKGTISLYIKAAPVMRNNVFAGGIVILEDIGISAGTNNSNEFKAQALDKLYSRLDDILFISDIQGKVIFSAGKNLDKLEVSPREQSFYISRIISPENTEMFDEVLGEVISKRVSRELVFEMPYNNMSSYYNCRIEPFISGKGRVQFIFFLLKDITKSYVERKNLISRIAELSRYQLISENISDAVFTLNEDGNITFWSESAARTFNQADEEVSGRFVGEALGIFDEEYFNNIKSEIYKKGSWKVNLSIYSRDGSKEILETTFTLPSEGSEEIIVNCRTITARVNEEKKLKQSEERLRTIVSQADELICTFNPDGTISYANNKFLSSLKYTSEEIKSKKFIDLIDPEYKKKNLFDFTSFERTQARSVELPLITRKGYTLIVMARFSAVYSEDNVISSYNGYFTDITEKKASEKDLKIYKSLFDVTEDGIAIEREGKIIIANNSFANIFRYDKAETLTGKEVLDLIANTDTLRAAEYLKKAEDKKQTRDRLECLGRRLDGSSFYIEVSVSSFEFDSKKYIVLVIRDITERKRVQQVIRESEEKYRNITENIDDFLYTFERSAQGFRPTFYTSSVEKVTGYSQVEFLTDSKLLLKIVHPDDFPVVKKRLKSILRSRIQVSEELELRLINKHGNIVWVRNKLNLTRNSEGKVIRMYGLISDITLRKKAEEDLTRYTENLVKLNETKDRFISIISHDLRTPFTSILGFTDLLLSDDGLNEEERKQYVKFIRESSQSMLQLVNSLLDWTRLQTGRIKFEPEKIDIRKVLEKSVNSLSGAAFQKEIEIVSLVNDEVSVFIDKNLMMQVFNNLLSNAIKFTRRNGKITISAAPSERTRFIEFSIKDNGVGIKPENLSSLFRIDAKFTSEGTAGEKGSGLGLSLVKEIIDKHGGQISVSSTYGEGTEFKFLLPVASANILLVDDSKTDRLLYSKILRSITPDYNIELASNGKEAFEKIITSPPALIITDHLMPEMNGYELINALKRSDIKVKPPIMVLSSELDRAIIADYNEMGIEYVFNKPVNLSSFKKAVEKSLKKNFDR